MAYTYKVTFNAAESWFFGNEKNFIVPDQKNGKDYSNSYFIKSEFLPSQTAVLGVLRYILIPNKKPMWQYNEYDKQKNAECIGKTSFDPDSKDIQEFGKIKKISPVFIIRDGETLIPVPLDHILYHKENDKDVKNNKYTPFTKYTAHQTSEDKKLTASEYDAKAGLTDGFVSLADGTVYRNSDIFVTDERTGINRSLTEKGFFKKQYVAFKTVTKEEKNNKTVRTPHKCSFAVYAEIDEQLDGKQFTVTMGQGKSPFTVKFEQSENTLCNDAESFIGEAGTRHITELDISPSDCSLLYCLSDCFISEPYDGTLFAVTEVKDYRAFKTNDNGKVEKGALLHRLIKAGSVFIVPNSQNPLTDRVNKNASNIGFNTILNIGGLSE